MATYKQQLHKIVEQSSFPADRAEDIKHDLKSAFSDGSIIGEMFADIISNVVGTAINELGIDKFVSLGTEGIKDFLKEATLDAIKSYDFMNDLSQKLTPKEADLDMPYHESKEREMGI